MALEFRLGPSLSVTANLSPRVFTSTVLGRHALASRARWPKEVVVRLDLPYFVRA